MRTFFFWAAVAYLSSLFLLCLFFPWLGIASGLQQNVENILSPPSHSHWFGTDSLGRDLLARVLSGGRVSLLIGVVCALLAFIIGFFYGALAGWYEGAVDRLLMRFCDIVMAIPSFILVSVLCLSLQNIFYFEDAFVKALVSLCIGISLTHWMNLARVVRGLILELKRKPFVEAAVALGGSRFHILLKHLLPNMKGTLLILIAMQVPSNILYESFMSFIGLGIHPPHTSWGILVKEGWKTLSSFPHLILFPALTLFLTVWSVHIVVDKLRSRSLL